MLNFCTQCGHGVAPYDHFCSRCGHNLDNDVTNAPVTEFHWPQDFYRGNPVEIADRDVDKYVQKVRDYLSHSQDENDYSFIASGDVIVWGYRHDDGIDIYVSRNYFHLNGFMDKDGSFERCEEEE